MKKTYNTPTLVAVGSVVVSTLSGDTIVSEPAGQTMFKNPLIGNVGYYL
jgi:hypothetical protein